MPQQLSINSGAQDGLLFDNSRSFFTNTGYTRTSNFQVEYRDIDPQNTVPDKLGTKIQFVIPRTGDLIGNMDLMCKLKGGAPTEGSGSDYDNGDKVAWVDAVGYAMIDKIEFSVGTNKVFETTGDALYIENETMRDRDFRYTDIVLRDSAQNNRVAHEHGANANDSQNVTTDYQLIVPLSMFFSKHPSQYLPLAALTSCNDIRIAISFKAVADLVQNVGNANVTDISAGCKVEEMKLRCHYVHVTGQEAESIVSTEHVRLIREVQSQQRELFTVNNKGSTTTDVTKTFTLSFLHPVSEIMFVIRRATDLTDPIGRNYFAFEGAPIDEDASTTKFGSCTRQDNAGVNPDRSLAQLGLELRHWKLTLNGQDRHSEQIDRDYTIRRLLPLHHSEGTNHEDYAEVYVIPFALNPEGLNPSGSLNFSKVSNAKLTLVLRGGTGHTNDQDYQLDILAYNYNWLQIKDGRALLSFS